MKMQTRQCDNSAVTSFKRTNALMSCEYTDSRLTVTEKKPKRKTSTCDTQNTFFCCAPTQIDMNWWLVHCPYKGDRGRVSSCLSARGYTCCIAKYRGYLLSPWLYILGGCSLAPLNFAHRKFYETRSKTHMSQLRLYT